MKWQWNKAGALLNYEDFLQALRLSTESYGFTQQQVGMQMDTVARKAEALREQVIALTTGNGGLSTSIKELLSLATEALQFIDRFSSAQIGLITTGGLLVAKWGSIARVAKGVKEAVSGVASSMAILNTVQSTMAVSSAGDLFGGVIGAYSNAKGAAQIKKELATANEVTAAASKELTSTMGNEALALMSTAQSAGNLTKATNGIASSSGKAKSGFAEFSANLMALLPGPAKFAGAVIMAAGAIDIFNSATDQMSTLQEQADNAAKMLELENETIARQEQGLDVVKDYITAYNGLNEQVQANAEGTEAHDKALQNLKDTHEALVAVVGEEMAAELEANSQNSTAIDEIIGKERDKLTERKNGESEYVQAVRRTTNELRKETKNRIALLNTETQSWWGVSSAVWEYGGAIEWVRLQYNALQQVLNNLSGSIINLGGDFMRWMRDVLGLDKIGGHDINDLIAEYDKGAQAKFDNAHAFGQYNEEMLQQIRDKVAIQGYGAANKAIGTIMPSGENPYDTEDLGGSIVDESGGGSGDSGKKGKKRVFDMEGNEIRIPNASNYLTEAGVDRNVTQDTELKLRVMDEAFYRKYGQHLLVSSMKRYGGGGSWHDSGQAFDLVGDILEQNPDVRQWLQNYGEFLQLTPLDEYLPENYQYWQGKSGGGPNLHFTNKGASIYDILGGQAKTNAKYTDNSPKRKLYDTLIGLGLNDKQAWAAMASIGGESGFDPGAIEYGKTFETGGIGLMQWTGSRKDDYLKFVQLRAAQGGSSDWRDLDNQLAFLAQEFNGSQASYWQEFLSLVTATTSARDDVLAFTKKVERAGITNLDNRMQYYDEISSHYVNGMSLYDSDPSKVKQLTPEQKAEKEAKRLQKYYNMITKAADMLSKVLSEKYKYALDAINENQQLFGQNLKNTGDELDVYQAKMADDVTVTEQYNKALERITQDLSDDNAKLLFNKSKEDFLKLEVEEQQKLVAGINEESALYKPILATLNAIVKVKQKIRESDQKYRQDQLKYVKLYQSRLKMRYNKPIQGEKDKMREWEITHSNEKYDDFYKNIYEQQHLEEIARLAKQEYDEMQKFQTDKDGKILTDRNGNRIRGGTPEEIEKAKQAWLEADAAAKKYAATLKNDVNKQFTEFANSILIQGENLRDRLKNLWRQLGEDALTLLLSGGKEGTNSLLGNILRRWVNSTPNSHKDDFADFQSGSFGYHMPYSPTFTTYATGPISSQYQRGDGNYLPSVASIAQTARSNAPVVGVDPLTGEHFATVNSATMGNPVPVIVTNASTIASGINGAVVDGLPDGTAIPTSQYSFGADGSVTNMAQTLQGTTGFATKYNWGMPTANNGWGSVPIGNKIGIFANTLPWLFGLFRHHATGGKVDKEEIATLGENDKTEYVIPTEQNQPRGVALWKKAGEDLGVLSKGSPVVPNFKNKQLATNGVMSVQVKQQAVYMEQMKRQNQTLLNILSAMANNQANGGQGATTVMQPVVVKQSMSVSEFTEMYQKGKNYNYLR